MLIGTETEIIEQGNLHIHTEQGQGFPKPGRQALAVSDEFQQSIGDQFCVMIDAASSMVRSARITDSTLPLA